MHIAKYLAQCEVDSRRACEKLVDDGRVLVNGNLCKPGQQIVLNSDVVEVDGVVVHPKAMVAYIIHKARGVDMETTINLIDSTSRFWPALPLEAEAEGAIFAVSDSSVASALSGSHGFVERIFTVSVRGRVIDEVLAQLRGGIPVGDKAGLVRIRGRILHEGLSSTLLRIVINERDRRYLRHAFSFLGHTILEQHALGVSSILLMDLAKGQSRLLNHEECDWLIAAANQVHIAH